MAENKYIYQEIDLLAERYSRYFLPIEWSHLPYIDPLFFIDNYFNSNQKFNLDSGELKIYCLNHLQLIFRRIFKRFCQGPLDQSYADFIKKQLAHYLLFRNIFLKGQYSGNLESFFNSENQSQLIIDLYDDLKQLRKQAPLDLVSQKIIIADKFNYSDFRKLGWQYRVINFLKKYSQKKLGGLIDSFLIHGSFASRDFLDNWSDLDALIILNEQVFQNQRSLDYFRKNIRRLDLICYKIDPLAHHLFLFLTAFDLDYYANCFFPIVLYDYSVLLTGKLDFEVQLRPDKHQRIQIIADLANRFRERVLKEEYSQNLIRWKEDLAQIMLWPSLILQAKDIYVYKKDSFEKIKQVFPELDFSVVDQATNLMRSWLRPNPFKYYPNLFFDLLPQRLNQIIINRCRKHLMELPIRQSQEQIKKITQETLNLMEQAISLILKDLN